jgi:hypothetical protein
MDEQNVELTGTGGKVQGITAAAILAVGALMKAGVIGASVANPIATGATILSAFLPSLFGRKTPPAGLGLLSAPVLPGQRLSAAASVIAQLVALLTAACAWLGQIPPQLVPEAYQPWVALVAAAVSAVLPGLQRLAEVFGNR